MLLNPGEIYTLADRCQETLDPMLITAICLVESSGNPWAMRYEPGYRWTVADAKRPPGSTLETEMEAQKFSYGLCQIMGATARGIGYDRWLSELFEPSTNLYWGCAFLESLARRFGDTTDLIAAYNAGSPRRTTTGKYQNQGYVDKVLDRMKHLQAASGRTSP